MYKTFSFKEEKIFNLKNENCENYFSFQTVRLFSVHFQINISITLNEQLILCHINIYAYNCIIICWRKSGSNRIDKSSRPEDEIDNLINLKSSVYFMKKNLISLKREEFNLSK